MSEQFGFMLYYVNTFIKYLSIIWGNFNKRFYDKCQVKELCDISEKDWLNLTRDWFPKFANERNIKIDVVHKVYEWPSCLFVKIFPSWENHFGKRTAWSLIYFMNYDYFDISPIRKFWESVSNHQQGSAFFTHKKYPGGASIPRTNESFPLKPSLMAIISQH